MMSKQTVDNLLCKRSYVDLVSNLLVLLQGEKAPPSAAHVPEKYSRILHIISYRYTFHSKGQGSQVLTATHLSNGTQVRRL